MIDIIRPTIIIARLTMATVDITRYTNITIQLTMTTDGKSITAITLKNIDITSTVINIIAPVTGMIITTTNRTGTPGWPGNGTGLQTSPRARSMFAAISLSRAASPRRTSAVAQP